MSHIPKLFLSPLLIWSSSLDEVTVIMVWLLYTCAKAKGAIVVILTLALASHLKVLRQSFFM